MTGKTDDVVMFLLKQDKSLLWDLKPHKEGRRTTQNSYYWQLVDKVAEATGISTFEIHNRNLRDLGLVERREDGGVKMSLEPDTDEGERDALNDPDVHLMPTHKTLTGNNGERFRFYIRLRGSSTFTVAEFSRLTDLIVQEAQAQGIETMTPNQLEHIRELERQHEERQKQKRLTPRPD